MRQGNNLKNNKALELGNIPPEVLKAVMVDILACKVIIPA